MDLDNTKELFFLRENFEKTNGFDSYSKNTKDILAHYSLKYVELPQDMKSPIQYTLEYWNFVYKAFVDKWDEVKRLLFSPFEMYTAAFLLAFHMEYEKSIILFCECQKLLPKTLSGQMNYVFINLQVAQLFERIGKDKQAFSILMTTRATIQHDKLLFKYVHNFYASCCVSIGLLCYRYKSNPQIATSCLLTSTLIRSKYKSSYSSAVYKHYLAHAYRYVGMMSCLPHRRAYIFLQASYKMRSELLQTFSDDITKEEMFHLESDFIIFLIRNQYKTSLIDRHAKALQRLISEFSSELRQDLLPQIKNISNTLHRFYNVFYMNDKEKEW